jgi:hypothetical protein
MNNNSNNGQAQPEPAKATGAPLFLTSSRNPIKFTLDDLYDVIYRRTMSVYTLEMDQADWKSRQQCCTREEVVAQERALEARVDAKNAIREITGIETLNGKNGARQAYERFLAIVRAGSAPYQLNPIIWFNVAMKWAKSEVKAILDTGFMYNNHVLIDRATYIEWKQGRFDHFLRPEPIPGEIPPVVRPLRRGFNPNGGPKYKDPATGEWIKVPRKKSNAPRVGNGPELFDRNEARKGNRVKYSKAEHAAGIAKRITRENEFLANVVLPGDCSRAQYYERQNQIDGLRLKRRAPHRSDRPLKVDPAIWKTPAVKREVEKAFKAEADEAESGAGKDIGLDGQDEGQNEDQNEI